MVLKSNGLTSAEAGGRNRWNSILWFNTEQEAESNFEEKEAWPLFLQVALRYQRSVV